MTTLKKKYKKFLITVFLSMALITAAIAGSDLYREIANNWKMVHEVYKRLMTHYADQIDPEKLAIAGIKGMLSELDPYTVYMEKEDRYGLDLLTHGKYGGVGIHLGTRDDTLTVIAPMEGTPAKRMGIMPGDKIIKIDGESTKSLSLDDAAKKIRGERKTKVVLTIKRYGEANQIDFELTRENIIVNDISYSSLISENIGYVRLTRFSKNAATEMRRTLLNLKEQGISHLILDFRGNPGGLLDASITILDYLTEKESVLLSTKGRARETIKEYISQSDPIIGSDISLVVLIDKGSASASEIVAGAIQDLDRGLIIGTQSFGKGLVQTLYPIDSDRSVKITTAKYYIPSGRLIQTPGYMNEEVLLSQSEEDTIFQTKNGRIVEASGGITPDIVVEQEKMGMLARECWRRGLFFNFASVYKNEHEVSLPIEIDSLILSEFEEFITTKEIVLTVKGEKEFNSMEALLDSTAENLLEIKHFMNILDDYFEDLKAERFEIEKDRLVLGLEREFSSILGGNDSRIESSFNDDPVLLKSIEVLSDMISFHDTLLPSEN